MALIEAVAALFDTNEQIPTIDIEKCRTLNIKLSSQCKFIESGKTHKKLMRSELIDSARATLTELRDACAGGNGYEDPNGDAEAPRCVLKWQDRLNGLAVTAQSETAISLFNLDECQNLDRLLERQYALIERQGTEAPKRNDNIKKFCETVEAFAAALKGHDYYTKDAFEGNNLTTWETIAARLSELPKAARNYKT